MKKFYLTTAILFVLAFIEKTNAQLTTIDNNHSLSGFPIFTNSIFFESDIDSTFWTSNGSALATKLALPVKSDDNGGGAFLNNTLYFSGYDTQHGSEVWVTDGTVGGTHIVQDMNPGSGSSNPQDFFVFNGNVYFTDSASPTSHRQLYVISKGSISPFKTINSTGSSFTANSADFFSFNNKMYFTANDGSHGTELWVSDGTAANTKMLSDITPGGASTSFGQFITLGTNVIFTVISGSYSLDLYKTDGTTTSLIKSFNIPFSAIGALGLINFKNKIYFGGTDLTNGTELWSTDGTSANTLLVKDINAGTDGSNPVLFNAVFVNNGFVFSATTDSSGTELWYSDGTGGNTVQLKGINPGVNGSDPILMPEIDYSRVFQLQGGDILDIYDRTALFNGYIFFSADDGSHGKQLWKTNGTANGTTMVANIGGTNGGVGDSYFYTKGGLFFAADDGTHGMEPWYYDGNAASLVKDINPNGSSDPEFQFLFNNHVYLTADNGDNTSGLTDVYRIDATSGALPIQLLSFKAVLQNTVVHLAWSTASENNSSNFVIQRSSDGTHFFDIGQVAAAGNSSKELTYAYDDADYNNAGSNTLFYRLKLTDKDGTFTYSDVQSVQLSAAGNTLRIYPNPVHDQLNVVFSTSSPTAALQIIDVNGKKVYQQKYEVNKAAQLQNIDVSTLANGTYFVQLVTGSNNETIKFVKK